MCEAVDNISEVAQGNFSNIAQQNYERSGELAAALDDFDDNIIINPLLYDDTKDRPSLEYWLSSIISAAELLADLR